MKKRIILVSDIPVMDTNRSPLQDVMYKYILNHPNCTRSDLYSLNPNEGTIRRAITKLLKSRRIKETFAIT